MGVMIFFAGMTTYPPVYKADAERYRVAHAEPQDYSAEKVKGGNVHNAQIIAHNSRTIDSLAKESFPTLIINKAPKLCNEQPILSRGR